MTPPGALWADRPRRAAFVRIVESGIRDREHWTWG